MKEQSTYRWRCGCSYLACACTVITIILGTGCSIRVTGGLESSAANLRGIGHGIKCYHDSYGKLPAIYEKDGAGNPLLSWRVSILPFMEGSGLYSAFEHKEAWDSPHNRKLENVECWQFRKFLGMCGPGQTIYHIIVGPGSAFEHDGLKLNEADFPDGLGNTLLVVEGYSVPWTKPENLIYDPRGPLPKFGNCYSKNGVRGFNVVFADGNSGFIPSDTPEKLLRSMITRNGGEKIDVSKFKK